MTSSHPLHALENMSVNQGARHLPMKAVRQQPGPYHCYDAQAIVDNNAVQDCGESFTEAMLKLLPEFIADARSLADTLEAAADD